MCCYIKTPINIVNCFSKNLVAIKNIIYLSIYLSIFYYIYIYIYEHVWLNITDCFFFKIFKWRRLSLLTSLLLSGSSW